MALTVPPAFASIEELEQRWRTLDTAERTRAKTLLEDASQMLLDEDTRGVLSPLTEPTLTLKRVVCAMVMRAMASGIAEGPPVTQASNAMGPFNEARTFANPTGDLYLTKAERRSLRFTGQRAGGVDMWAGAYTPEVP